ncbi:MAG: 50S ribosomal protein L10 [Chlamydia sp.]
MKREKELLLDEIQGQIAKSGSFIITQYDKMTANSANAFRRELQKVGGSFEVVRKRVFLRAAARAGFVFSLKEMQGHIGIVLASADPIETTKTVLKYGSEEDVSFALLGGYVEGQIVSSQDMKKLALLPSKDQMRSEILGLFEAPMAQTLAVMDALLTSVLHCMNNRADKEEKTEVADVAEE